MKISAVDLRWVIACIPINKNRPITSLRRHNSNRLRLLSSNSLLDIETFAGISSSRGFRQATMERRIGSARSDRVVSSSNWGKSKGCRVWDIVVFVVLGVFRFALGFAFCFLILGDFCLLLVYTCFFGVFLLQKSILLVVNFLLFGMNAGELYQRLPVKVCLFFRVLEDFVLGDISCDLQTN